MPLVPLGSDRVILVKCDIDEMQHTKFIYSILVFAIMILILPYSTQIHRCLFCIMVFSMYFHLYFPHTSILDKRHFQAKAMK